MIELTESNFNKEVVEYKGKVIIDVWANWCGRCKMIKPTFAQKANENKDYKFCTLDADANQALCGVLTITNLPTFIIYEDGKEIKRGGAELINELC